MLPSILPDCANCFYGYTERCGGHATALRQALQKELRGEHEGVGCKGDPSPIIQYLHFRRHPVGDSCPLPQLPLFIPQILTAGLNSIPLYPPGLNTFAVSLSTLFTPHGKIRWTDKRDLRKALRLPLDARLLVVGSGDDLLLEKIWNRMVVDDVWKKMAALGLMASTGFSFSVWDLQTRMDQIINQERNLLTCRYLLANGIPAIPIVFWYDKYDFQNLVRWLLERRITTVAILAQFIRGYQRFEHLCEDMRCLQDALQEPLHYVVIGTSRPRRMSRLLAEFSCSIATSHPFVVAVQSGGEVRQNLDRELILDRSHTREELAALNVGRYYDFCTQCVGRPSQTPIQLTLLNPYTLAGPAAPQLASTT